MLGFALFDMLCYAILGLLRFAIRSASHCLAMLCYAFLCYAMVMLCAHVPTGARLCTCVPALVHQCAQVWQHKCVQLCMSVHTCVHVCTHTCTQMHTRAHMCTVVRAHLCTLIKYVGTNGFKCAQVCKMCILADTNVFIRMCRDPPHTHPHPRTPTHTLPHLQTPTTRQTHPHSPSHTHTHPPPLPHSPMCTHTHPDPPIHTPTHIRTRTTLPLNETQTQSQNQIHK